MLQGPGLVVAAATGEDSPRLDQGFDTRAIDESLESLETHAGSLGSIGELAECAQEECDAPSTGNEFQVGFVSCLSCLLALCFSPLMGTAC